MSHSFSDLLQAGEIDSAIDLRLTALEGEATSFRVNSEAAKISSAALAVVGLALSANPLLLVLGGLGAAGYTWAVAKDSTRTGRLRPIPGSRKGIAELFEGIASAAGGQTEAAVDPLHQTMSCLTPELAHEYELLSVSDGPVFKMLNAIQPEKRIAGYRHILRQTRLRDSLLLPALADVQAAISLPAAPESATSDQTIGSDTRLGAIAASAVEVAQSVPADDSWVDRSDIPSTSVPVQVQPDGDRFLWVNDLLNFPAVLVWGAQGSGKTSFAAWLLHQRIKAGHHAWVCDPHKEYGQWNGLKAIGGGMDYEACDQAMLNFASTVKHAYKIRSEQANYQPQRETVLVEEFTNWASRCENAAEFFAASLSDLRKIRKGVIFVSHDRTLIALGGSKGFSNARNGGLLELQLEARVDPQTGDPVPALKGKLKLPGKSAISVEIAPWMNGSMDFTRFKPATSEQQNTRAKLEGLFRKTKLETDETELETNFESGETSFEPGETGETIDRVGDSGTQNKGVSSFEPGVSSPISSRFDPERVRRVLEMRRNEMKQTQIIAIEWGVKPGKSTAYDSALIEYKAIMDHHWKG